MMFETVKLGDAVLFNPRESIKKGAIAKKIDMSVLNLSQEIFRLMNCWNTRAVQNSGMVIRSWQE